VRPGRQLDPAASGRAERTSLGDEVYRSQVLCTDDALATYSHELHQRFGEQAIG
jgi:hypothetical protein